MSEENTIIPDKVKLPFNDFKQKALLGHLLINTSFFKLSCKKIKSNWFKNPNNEKIFKFLVEYYDKYKYVPTLLEFKEYKGFQSLDPGERRHLIAWMTICKETTRVYKLQSLKEELTEWLHSTILLKGMSKASKEYNDTQIKECYQTLMESVKEISVSRFDGSDEIDFSDFKQYLSKAKEERANALTTGLKLFDKMLLSDSTGGGLQRGDTTIVMAPVNCGKTTTLITIACHNIIAGKDVLFITHEGRPEDIQMMFLANLLGRTRSEVIDMYSKQENMEEIEKWTKQLIKHLKYIPYNKAGMTVEDVVPIIRNCQEDWMAVHDGKGFDLLVNDYPALLSTEMARRGNLQKRNIDELVYDSFVQLALEYKFHALLAIQTNREGSRVNRGTSSEKRLLTIEDVQESWGPIAKATNVITLNRSPEASNKNIIIFSIAKSRSSRTGIAIMVKCDFTKCRTHSEEWGGIAYVGGVGAEEHYDKLIEGNCNNTELTQNVCMQLGLGAKLG